MIAPLASSLGFPLNPLTAITATVTALAGTCVYAALSAGSQLFGPTLIANRNPNQIALTFDDGPNDPCTHQLLEILAEHQLRASFFMIGRFVCQRPDIVRAVHQAGHVIGNHTMTHPWLVFESPASVHRELANCSAALEDVVGEKIHYFRPPHGARRPDVLSTAEKLGLTPVMWNVMAHDWEAGICAADIQGHIEKGISRNRGAGRSTNIVLHDGGQAGIGQDRSATVQAVRHWLRKENASFITVDQLTQPR